MTRNYAAQRISTTFKTFAATATATAIAGAAVLFPAASSAQARYPDKPIRIVVPFSPGGNTDIVARRYAIKLTSLVGQSVVIDNKAGADGAIGSAEIARARPDGYNLLMGTVSTHSINPLTVKNLSYDAVKDFVPVAIICTVPLAIVVHSSGPKTLTELIERVRANPGKLSYGTPGVGSLNHLAGELIKKRLNLDMLHVPFKGGGQSIQNLMANQIPIAVATFSSAIAAHRDGRIRILAVFSDKRAGSAPDIPTAAEAGLPGISTYTYNAIFAPANTPPAVMETLFQATRKIVTDEDFQRSLASETVEIVTDSTPASAREFIRNELEKWNGIFKEIGGNIH